MSQKNKSILQVRWMFIFFSAVLMSSLSSALQFNIIQPTEMTSLNDSVNINLIFNVYSEAPYYCNVLVKSIGTGKSVLNEEVYPCVFGDNQFLFNISDSIDASLGEYELTLGMLDIHNKMNYKKTHFYVVTYFNESGMSNLKVSPQSDCLMPGFMEDENYSYLNIPDIHMSKLSCNFIKVGGWFLMIRKTNPYYVIYGIRTRWMLVVLLIVMVIQCLGNVFRVIVYLIK